MKFSFSIPFFGKKKSRTASSSGKRSEAGSNSRLYADWTTATRSANAAIAAEITTVRNRSRQLEEDNDYAEKFYKLLENNVLGHSGITLQMKSKNPDGSFDKIANDKIEAGRAKWCRKEYCTIDEQDSWRTCERLILRSTARDGGCFIRLVPGANNAFNFAVQLLEADMLDVGFNGRASNGNEIVMGVELGEFTSGGVKFRKPVAYWFFRSHPGDVFFGRGDLSLERVPATNIIHTFIKKRIGAVVGMPWMQVSMASLKMLDGYEEAVLVAAREGACKGGYITKEAPTEYHGDGVDPDGNKVHEMEPGVVRELNPGENFVSHDPTHPMQEYAPYVKNRLRRFCSGVGVSYNSLANDLEGVNYSSIRAGLLDERDVWKGLQEWFIETVETPVFEAWLPNAMLSGEVNLPIAKKDKFLAAEWKGRRWAWVDPLKDVQAAKESIRARFTTRTQVISEGGGDFEEVIDETKAEEAYAEKQGVDLDLDDAIEEQKTQALLDRPEPQS